MSNRILSGFPEHVHFRGFQSFDSVLCRHIFACGVQLIVFVIFLGENCGIAAHFLRLISVLQMRSLLFLLLVICFLISSGSEVLLDVYRSKMESYIGPAGGSLLSRSKTFVTKVSCFLSKIPDELEMEHRYSEHGLLNQLFDSSLFRFRYIAASCIVNVNGPELADAAAVAAAVLSHK